MSYNITRWKIAAAHLALPLDFDFQGWLSSQPDRDERGYENVGKRWCREDESALRIDLAAQTWELSLSGMMLDGRIVDHALIMTSLDDWTDEGSGILYNDILLPLFREFKGTLEAIVVWEGGDSIVQLHILDGIVSEQSIA